jgi:hypothetical protein
MAVHIGGKDSYLQRVIGDIVCSFQWINDEPAMILWPKVRRTLNNAAYVICLSAAYKYADPRYLVTASAEAAETIGMDVSKYTVYRIADIIIEGLPDLLAMPPSNKAWKEATQQEQIGELLIKVDGQTIKHTEVTVPQGMSTAGLQA